MEKLEFKLKSEFVNLVQVLKYLGVISTGGEISNYMENDLIFYNGTLEHRKRKKLYAGDVVVIDNKIEVSIIE